MMMMIMMILVFSIGSDDQQTSGQTEQCSGGDFQGAALSSTNNDMIPDLFPQVNVLCVYYRYSC